MRYEISDSGTARVLINGAVIYETSVTVTSPTAFRIILEMRDDSQNRNSTVTLKNTRFLEYAE